MNRFQPFDYQKIAIERIINNPRYGLFVDMGAGKTVITLTAISELMYDRLEINKVLVVAPKKVAESTWQDETEKWRHLSYLSTSTILGDLRKRVAALQHQADIYIINRENVPWLVSYYKNRLPFDMVVLDESSSFKNPSAQRFRALKKVRGTFPRLVELTGTPSPRSMMDLWAQLYLLDGGERLGRTIGEYRRRYFLPEKTNGPIVYSYRLANEGAERKIWQKIEDICMSLKGCIRLPESRSVTIPVNLDEKSREMYRQLEKQYVLEFKDKEITAANAATLSNKLLQLGNGAVYDDDQGVVEVHQAKLDALADIVENNSGQPILVFYAYEHDKKRLMERFPEAEELQGPEEMRRWNRGEISMLLAHPASAAYGLNLQAGGHIIVWFGLTWSLELYKQANARLARTGQTEMVIIHHLVVRNSIDEQVMRALERKDHQQEALLEAIKLRIEEVRKRG